MRSCVTILICLWILAFRLNGDMGSIPFYPTAVILEPNQRALIAYNGLEEILILSTDLKADRETKVLEIMPLPSEPAVTNADVEIFQKVTALINLKLARMQTTSVDDAESLHLADEDNQQSAGRVTFHDRIGAHDVSVTHVEWPDQFVAWAKKYLASQGADTPTIPASLEEVIGEYIRENFTWFVFDAGTD